MLCVGVTTFPLNVSPLLVLLPHGGLGVGRRVPDNHCALKIFGRVERQILRRPEHSD